MDGLMILPPSLVAFFTLWAVACVRTYIAAFTIEWAVWWRIHNFHFDTGEHPFAILTPTMIDARWYSWYHSDTYGTPHYTEWSVLILGWAVVSLSWATGIEFMTCSVSLLVGQSYLLFAIVAFPVAASLLIMLLPEKYTSYSRMVALVASVIVLTLCIDLWKQFDMYAFGYQFTSVHSLYQSINISYSLGIDGLSLLFVVLTGLLTPICLLSSWNVITHRVKEYYALFMLMESCVMLVFTTMDLFVFYLAFEVVLIPMYLMIGFYGSRERKIRASYFFFLYTLVGSILMLASILYLWVVYGTTDINSLMSVANSSWLMNMVWIGLFASFAVKVPMFPVHIWLPEAHVEAPTAGSVFLAGILLKLGTYGLLRFCVSLYGPSLVYFSPFVLTIAVCGVVYASLTAIRQTDMKRIIAYSSVAHINFTVLGVFSWTHEGISGGVLQILSHGLVASAMFLCVGVLYDRYHSRLVSYYGGIAQTIPVYVAVFLYFTMANIAIPGTSSFVGEFLVLLGLYELSTFVAVISCAGMVLGGAYSLWMFNRMAYGHHKVSYLSTALDIGNIELATLTPLLALSILMGLYPEVFLIYLQTSIDDIAMTISNTHHA
jgi:NADH-quinone oxidoreductase subunit M